MAPLSSQEPKLRDTGPLGPCLPGIGFAKATSCRRGHFRVVAFSGQKKTIVGLADTYSEEIELKILKDVKDKNLLKIIAFSFLFGIFGIIMGFLLGNLMTHDLSVF